MSTKKKTTQTSNQTQTAAPPAWTLPGLTAGGNAVTAAMNAALANPQPYTGEFVAGMDPGRVAAQTAAYDTAAGTAGDMGTFARQALEKMFAPVDSGKLLQDAITASIHPVFQQLTEQTLPGITNSALQSGAYTNDRALGVLPTEAIANATESAQRIGAELGWEGFQAEQNRNLERTAQLPALTNLVAQMASARGDLLGMGTTLDQQLRQETINNERARHDYNIGAPYESISPAAQLLAMLSGNYGTQTSNGTQTTVQKTSGLGPILQGALGLASAAGSLGAFGPLGGVAGAAGAAPAAINNIPAAIAKMQGASQLFNPFMLNPTARPGSF
jgi:hypothetical protein